MSASTSEEKVLTAACQMDQHALCHFPRWADRCDCYCHAEASEEPIEEPPEEVPETEVAEYKKRQEAAQQIMAREKAAQEASDAAQTEQDTSSTADTNNEEDSMSTSTAPNPGETAESNGGEAAQSAETPATKKDTKYRVYNEKDLKGVSYTEVEAKNVPAAIRAHVEKQPEDFKGGKFVLVADSAFNVKEVSVQTKRSLSFD